MGTIAQGYRLTRDAAREHAALVRADWLARTVLLVLLGSTALVVAIPLVVDLHNGLLGGQVDLPSRLRLGTDRSAPEFLSYFQAAFCVAFLFAAYRDRRDCWLLFFSAAYLFVLIDDAFMYHERFGSIIAPQLGLENLAGLRAQDLGELAAWGIAALVLCILLAAAARERSPFTDGRAGVLFVLFGALVFFGIVLDMVYFLVGGKTLAQVVGYFEDGGEMFAIALACAYAHAQSRMALAPRVRPAAFPAR